MYKNILIITTTRDNTGSCLGFYKDINAIDPEYRDMIIACIERRDYDEGDLWSSMYGTCGSERGYIFNELPKFPITIDHIIDHVF